MGPRPRGHRAGEGAYGMRNATVFICRPGQDCVARGEEPVGSRYPCGLGPSRAASCIVCTLVVAAGVYYVIVADPSEMHVAVLLLAACGGVAALGGLVWRIEKRKRDILCAAGRIMFLAKSLPRRTDGETLAVVGEIRARYDEARGLVEGIGGDDGKRLAKDLRGRLDRIDREYDAEAGRLRRADASVADLASGVRSFSTMVDVRPII